MRPRSSGWKSARDRQCLAAIVQDEDGVCFFFYKKKVLNSDRLRRGTSRDRDDGGTVLRFVAPLAGVTETWRLESVSDSESAGEDPGIPSAWATEPRSTRQIPSLGDNRSICVFGFLCAGNLHLFMC